MSDEAKLDELLDRWEGLVGSGQPADPDALCAEHPELLAEFRQQIEILNRMDALLDTQPYAGAAPGDPGAKKKAAAIADAQREQASLSIDAGRYRPVRFHAAGGLGCIFVAHDDELQREVALKLMKREWSESPESRYRFALEAEITGRLEHPGIVPVYGFGHERQDQRQGQPYYTMRFIRGESLQAAIDQFHAADSATRDPGERSVELQKLLRSFLIVCETIAYAHSRGIIHRDLKPANVMLGKYGETLVVDWGLAKVVGAAENALLPHEEQFMPTTTADMGQSIMGLAKGSPAYMSPEQADGRWDIVGPASDIYSLGTILYTLLTGRRAFEGRSINEVFDKVRRRDFIHPRQVKSQVAPALEAICLKAMQREPAARYAQALDLAADIEHWLADEPVAAMPEPWTTRTRRWLKRHRTAVAGVTIGLFVTLIGLVVTTVILRVKNEQLSIARGRAEQNFDLAHGAVKDLLNQAGGNPVLHKPGMHRAQESLLRVALKYYRDFLSAGHDDPQLQQERAQAHLLVGQIVQEIGSVDEALVEYDTAQAILEKLAPIAGGPELESSLAKVATRLALLHGQLGHMETSRAHFKQAFSRYERLLADHPERTDFRLDLACLHLALGEATSDLKSLATARAMFEAAQPGGEPLPSEMQAALAKTYNALGSLYNLLGQVSDSAGVLERATQTLDGLGAAASGQVDIEQIRAQVELNRGALFQKRGENEPALALYRSAKEHFARLSQQNPDVSDFRLHLAEADLSLGKLYLATDQRPQAAEHLQAARATFEQLAIDNPKLLDRYQLARSMIDLGVLMTHADQPAAASDSFAQSRGLLETLVAIDDSNPSYQRDLAATYSGQGRIAMESDRFEAAVESFDKAREPLERIVRAHPERLEFRQALAKVYQNLGATQAVVGEWNAALNRFEQAAEIFAAQATAHPDVRQYTADREQYSRLLLAILCDGLKSELATPDRQQQARSAAKILRQELAFLKQQPQLDDDTKAAVGPCEELLKSVGE